MEKVICPKCHSEAITANQKGFNTTNAVLGNIAGGGLTGMGLGMMGSSETIITCLKCGNKFEPGTGAIKTINEVGEEVITYQHKDNSGKNTRIVVAVVLLVIIAIAIIWIYNWMQGLKG